MTALIERDVHNLRIILNNIAHLLNFLSKKIDLKLLYEDFICFDKVQWVIVQLKNPQKQ
jgi:hypothetical protein